MHTSMFFKLFPPPKFLVMKYAGLDISDDGIHCLEYAPGSKGMRVGTYAHIDLPAGIIDGGDIKDDKQIKEMLSKLNAEHGLSYVKASLPEEKVYLFQTDVPGSDMKAIAQNIEFKLEENVPLAAPDAVFYFDLLPMSVTGGVLRASVSVAPRVYIEQYISLLRGVGIFPLAFETVPKAIARAIVPAHSETTELIIHIMNSKTGMYVISGGVVCFTSTISFGGTAVSEEARKTYVQTLSTEINRVYAYWMSHGGVQPKIDQIMLAGHFAPLFENALQNVVGGASVPVKVAEIWQNVLDLDRYVPPISRDDSLDYAVSAGLAMSS